MYQSPNNQPDPNQSFYSDQTSQFSQQQPPPPPSYPQPGQYPQYPMQPPPVPQKKNIWRWYKRQKTPAKWGVGCGVLLLAFSCIMCSTAFASGFHDVGSTTTATATTAPTHAAAQAVIKPTPTAAMPTPTPTLKPTATPTPKPTAAPTAPPVVVVPPTHAPAPTAPPAPTQPPAPPACSGVIDDGTCYSTNPAGGVPAGTVPADFCTLVACVSTFWKDTNGSVALCVNGKYTHSYGVSGACSRDGGVAGQLYRH